MDIYETAITEHSGLKYKIQMRKNHGIWEQRHVWYPAPSTYVHENSVHVEEWIRSPGGPGKTFTLSADPKADFP